ncbi:hypothetical protein Lal_00035004 [Lupinus albus]|nr:hypothetical protein Lal_00035004 [Lupinus albus]
MVCIRLNDLNLNLRMIPKSGATDDYVKIRCSTKKLNTFNLTQQRSTSKRQQNLTYQYTTITTILHRRTGAYSTSIHHPFSISSKKGQWRHLETITPTTILCLRHQQR